MNPHPISGKEIRRAFFISITVILIAIFLQLIDKGTKIVFCDVGQGDATYIRIGNKVDVIVDAGPDKKILSCLGKHMPFWDRSIEMVFLSHHDIDHYGGLSYLIDRYKIERIVTINYRFDSQSYRKLVKKIEDKSIAYDYAYKNEELSVLDSDFVIYWPSKNLKTYDSNDYSLIILYRENDFRLLLTGDASPLALNRLSEKSLVNVDILKIPHHGSKNGLTEKFLELADPNVAVISVGNNNYYGHPSQKILDLLKAKNIQIRRTDEEGDIIFKLKVSP